METPAGLELTTASTQRRCCPQHTAPHNYTGCLVSKNTKVPFAKVND